MRERLHPSERRRSQPVRRMLRWLLGLRGSPRAIAGGVAVGMVVAFTPTVGFQILLSVGLATLLGVNRPAAAVPTGITNPLTIPPVYAFTYFLGSFFWSGPDPTVAARAIGDASRELASLDFLALEEQLGVLLGLGVDVFVPMWIGGLIVGGLAAAIAYPLTLRTVTDLHRRRERRREHRDETSPPPERPERGCAPGARGDRVGIEQADLPGTETTR